MSPEIDLARELRYRGLYLHEYHTYWQLLESSCSFLVSVSSSVGSVKIRFDCDHGRMCNSRSCLGRCKRPCALLTHFCGLKGAFHDLGCW